MLVELVFSYIAILLRLILRWVSFVGDALLVVAYCLALLPVFAPGLDPSIFSRDLMNTETLLFRIPLLAAALYIIIDLLLYRFLYQGVTTYGRFMYAIRTLILTLLPLVFVAGILTIHIQGNSVSLAQTSGEWIGFIVGACILIVTAWAFFGIAEFLIESITQLSISDSTRTVRHTYMTPRRAIQLLFHRHQEFETKQSFGKKYH